MIFDGQCESFCCEVGDHRGDTSSLAGKHFRDDEALRERVRAGSVGSSSGPRLCRPMTRADAVAEAMVAAVMRAAGSIWTPELLRRFAEAFGALLAVPHRGIGRTAGEQGCVCAAFDNDSVIEHEDLIGIHHCG